MKDRCAEREEEINFTVGQLRSKFKKCVEECKKAALTIKTASGIKRFQDEKGYGGWFNQLFALVRTRDSCQPELVVEPSAQHDPELEESLIGSNEVQKKAFVPIRGKKQEKKKETNDAVLEVLSLIKTTTENDPLKDMISLIKRR